VVLYELSRNPDVESRQQTLALAQMAHAALRLPRKYLSMRKRWSRWASFDAYDAAHLACAEAGGADVFLTTDDRVVKVAHRKKGLLNLRVDNPVQWLEEVLK
jgi:predicted nucleic acid-binding protein